MWQEQALEVPAENHLKGNKAKGSIQFMEDIEEGVKRDLTYLLNYHNKQDVPKSKYIAFKYSRNFPSRK